MEKFLANADVCWASAHKNGVLVENSIILLQNKKGVLWSGRMALNKWCFYMLKFKAEYIALKLSTHTRTN